MLKDRLRELRTQNKYTKKQVSKILKMTPEGYGYYESGIRTPSPETITTLASFYNVSTDYVLCQTDELVPLKKENPPSEDEGLFPNWVHDFFNLPEDQQKMVRDQIDIYKKLNEQSSK